MQDMKAMLQRHRLVTLSDAGWQHLLWADWDSEARDCMTLWAAQRWPLVVTRQRTATRIDLGLPAPTRFGRRRFAVRVEPQALLGFGRFPAARGIACLLRDESMASLWPGLCDRLGDAGCLARVYGSHGWQAITGLPYLHSESDIDLLLPVRNAEAADAVCTALTDHELRFSSPRFSSPRLSSPRIDGELMFPDGAGIAWREWLRWRRGDAHTLLVKRLHGVAMEVPAVSPEALPC